MSEAGVWRVRDLAVPGGLVGGPFGSSLGTKDYVPSGVPVIRGQNLASDKLFDSTEFVYVSEGKARDLSRNIAIPGDIVFTQRGTLGQVGLVADTFPRYVISQSQMRLRVDETKADPRFVYYWFRTRQMKEMIEARAITTGVPHINLGILADLPIPDLPLVQQSAIAGLLLALDDKIAANDRLAVTARELGTTSYAQASAVDDAEEPPIASLCALLTRGGPPVYTDDLGAPYVINQKCVRHGRVDLAPARRTEPLRVRKERLLIPWDVLVNSTGVGTLGRVGIWRAEVPATCDSHVTIVRFDAQRVPSSVGAYALLAAQPRIELLGQGSTGQTELSRVNLGELKIRIPPQSCHETLASRLSSLEDRVSAAHQESRALAELRDTLLPKLMSGELRVREAERVVSDAV